MGRKLTTEEFIEKAVEKYGDEFDYSKVEYLRGDKEVTIGCKIHGFIQITPNNHLKKKRSKNTGCHKCGIARKGKGYSVTQEELIRDFRKVHGDKYDYSKVKYQGNKKSKIIVICPIEGHGEYEITPSHHLEGRTCKKCVHLNQRNNLLNKRFGKLTVIKLADKKKEGIKDHQAFWWVQCSCGREPYIVPATQLTNKGIWACRVCGNRDSALKQAEEYFAKHKGNKYNLLTIERYWGSDAHGSQKALCKCECGTIKILKVSEVVRGTIKSCGCLPSGEDSYSYFKNNVDWANEECSFYLVEIDNDFLKIGITNNLKNRKWNSGGIYKNYIFYKTLTRAEVWTIEQIILDETKIAMPNDIPDKLSNFGGITETRYQSFFAKDFYINRFFELMEKLSEMGWEELYLSRYKIEN